MNQRLLELTLSACSSALLLAGCSGGGGSNAGTTSFQVIALSVRNGAIWQINREIEVTFSEPVDFSTVSANTINIRSVSDAPALGTFRLRGLDTVVFQPSCPTRADLSDAGLQPGTSYVLRIPSVRTSPNTVRSSTGVPLGTQQVRTFSTPASTQASVAFKDARVGPPAPVVRAPGSGVAAATHLEIGGDPRNLVYFERDEERVLHVSVPGFQAPLNLFSDRSSRIAVVVVFDQPVNPATSNISERRLRLEFRDPSGTWQPIETRVTLIANCTEAGARVRLEPVGILPRSSTVRAVVLPGFMDLTGDSSPSLQVNFARVPTRSVEFSSLEPADALSDELNESFEFGGSSPLSRQDTRVLFDTPTAEWGGGRLESAFSFEGTGGPRGDFDWIVHQGELFFFDTTSTFIVGGPNGVPTTTLHAVNGVVDVRNFTIERGGEIRVQGPNPMRINASGEVRIDGRLDLSGFPAKDVATLNTGNQVEVGGAGAAGGGQGGNANGNTTGPTPRGGRGRGPSGSPGGEGGEMGYSPESSKNARRPGGGGGGRFARDWSVQPPPNLSLAAGPGSNGNPRSLGADSGLRPSRGGAPGDGPFLDGRDDNDFFGVRPVASGGELVGLVRGELPSLWAGYGGGGGGNAGRAFPNPNWNFGSDEKGGGGGGGGGGLYVKALGRIVFGRSGLILALGARGGNGENTNFLDHIGGTGGGGSGGHVVLESATAVDFTAGGAGVNDAPRNAILAAGAGRKAGPTQDVDTCGQAPSHCCPQGCAVQSNGGPGGAGVIQIHVPDPLLPPGTAAPAQILVPAAALDAPDVMEQVSAPPAYVMTPTFGRRSKARSRWISIGGADQRPDGTQSLVRFLFEGIDPDTGRILTNGSGVAQRAPLWSDDHLEASATARILPDGSTLELEGAALAAIRAGSTSGISNDIYLRTPALLQDCSVRLLVVTAPANFEDFPIARAEYDEGAPPLGDESLRLTVAGTRKLTAFNPDGAAGRTGARLLPRFFRVVSGGIPDSLPSTTFVGLRFQAAADNGNGAPDEASPLRDWTSDVSRFNTLPAGALRFFRFEVEFDLDRDGGLAGIPSPVSLDFLKIPFVF